MSEADGLRSPLSERHRPVPLPRMVCRGLSFSKRTALFTEVSELLIRKISNHTSGRRIITWGSGRHGPNPRRHKEKADSNDYIKTKNILDRKKHMEEVKPTAQQEKVFLTHMTSTGLTAPARTHQ